MSEIEKLFELQSFRSLGERFNWLGVTMLVVGFEGCASLDFFGFQRAAMIANYFDLNGVLHIVHFSHSELPALRKENPAE